MKTNAMRKNLRQSIVKSFGRFIAIASIIALGAGLFLGLLMTKADMVATGQSFADSQNMFDLRMLSTYGWTEEYAEKFARLEGVAEAEGGISLDLIARTAGSEEDAVYRFHALPERINQVALRGGRMPKRADECLASGRQFDEKDLGTVLTLSDGNDASDLNKMRSRRFTIVGYVASPLYMDMNRGTTSVGNGNLADFYYVPRNAFDMDYYTEINLTLEDRYPIYTQRYNDALDEAVDTLEPQAKQLNEERFLAVKAEAEEAYQKGFQEYQEGVREYEDAKQEAEKELADAQQELLDGEQELKDNRKKLIDAGNEIEHGRKKAREAREQISQALDELQIKKAQAATEIPAAREQLNASYEPLKQQHDDLKTQQSAAAEAVQVIEDQRNNPDLDEDTKAQLEEKLAAANSQLSAINSQLSSVSGAMEQIQGQLRQLQEQEKQLASAEAQLLASQQEVWDGERELNAAEETLMVNWGLWHQAEKDLAQGWEDYEQAKADAEQELAEAEQELLEAEQELREAREEIDDMDKPELFILDRNSNVGFVNLDSNSDIVAGISRVLPVFFLLVASLVCITTMTRMIDEERTQIGTLKALGYTSQEIISKYLLYSGSSSLLGCALGIAAGSTVIPMIIWQAYCIMLYIQPNVVLTVNWLLCAAVTLAYTAVMLFVTWYCCSKTLREEPASLIRPKAPEAGKKMLLERLPVWSRISFLNKVTIRNIFRYRQRMAMMLLGIGGCTALLLTGFGLRDSIMGIMDFQFENVTHYDLQVYFREENTAREQREFEKALGEDAQAFLMYHQSNVELDYNNRVKEISLLSAGDELRRFISMRSGETDIAMPGENQMVLSVGAAENLGIHVGDQVILRGSDFRTMVLTVSGIYDNHVNNFAIVLPETVKGQWGQEPEKQMAFVQAAEGKDQHALGARISALNNVMTVSVSEDVATSVRGMMDALDLVVIMIIFCAGMLAVTVLYNLTNININERIREIATIKVLGFNARETAAYIFKENLILTVAGALLGLFFGKLLLMFVISQVKIDSVWFRATAVPSSYLLSIALTLFSAVAVNLIFSGKLEKINMAEALKSVE